MYWKRSKGGKMLPYAIVPYSKEIFECCPIHAIARVIIVDDTLDDRLFAAMLEPHSKTILNTILKEIEDFFEKDDDPTPPEV